MIGAIGVPFIWMVLSMLGRRKYSVYNMLWLYVGTAVAYGMAGGYEQ